MTSDERRELDDLVSAMQDGRLSPQQAGRLKECLAASPEAVEQYTQLLDNHEALCAIYPGDVFTESLAELANEADDLQFVQDTTVSTTHARIGETAWQRLALAAALLLMVGLGGYWYGVGRVVVSDSAVAATGDQEEQVIAGHAMLRRSVDLKWPVNSIAYHDGDVLPGGTLTFDQGIAEIDFFCGAALTVEGPAALEIESDWSVKVTRGRLRANVPPAARGFIVKAVDSEIIDLGTEFSLEVNSDRARIDVIDGEVTFRGGEHDGVHLQTGQRRWLGGEDDSSAFGQPSEPADLERRRDDAEASRFAQWREQATELRHDKRLIAYYPIAEMNRGRVVDNATDSGAVRNGTLVGPVGATVGRFGSQSHGLEFDRIGARVRTRIEGQFDAFTFMTWARIDSLPHRYNSLFMGDGYENGEPHWQIRDDGRLMFSVMVDDSADVRVIDRNDGTTVRDAGLHRIYMTDPIWDITKSGRWFQLAAVYDPSTRTVSQFVNGEQVSRETILDQFLVSDLRIGPAEIGNWGQPFRNSPWFAVRNFNGTIDELAVFNAALAPVEIKSLYEQGKPLGY